MMDSGPAATADHYAILIAIDAYPEKPLEGCVQDVHEIEQYLRQTVSPLDIQTFVAPRHADSSASNLSEDAQTFPTYMNVTNALRDINKRAKSGDYLYIHFSGHGARTQPDDEYSNDSTGDLALILLDASFSGPRLARFYLNPIVLKGVIVTLVLDCCFAASVFRRNDKLIRFLPNDINHYPIGRCDDELDEDAENDLVARKARDASMRLNWLMNPDRYAILTACGATQEGGEIVTQDGVTHGKLSYFLRKSFDHSGGCRKTHAAIHQYLCAAFDGHEVRQNPVLFGRKDQGFFGEVDTEGCKTIQVVKNGAGELQLLAGQAHGFRKGDRFVLHPVAHGSLPGAREGGVPAEISYLGGLASSLKTTATMADDGLNMWNASVLTQTALQDYPIHLHYDLPERIQLKAVFAERFLTVEDGEPPSKAFYITSGADQELEVRNGQRQLLANVPYDQAVQQIEHLIKFALVKELANMDAENFFQYRFRVYVESDGKRFDPNRTIEVKDKQKLRLVFENLGPQPLFFSLYDMSPSWQIQNLLCASYLELPARENAQNYVRHSKRIQMIIPETILDKGLRRCEDYIKIFVTSEPSLFDSVELPKLGQVVTPQKISNEPSKTRTSSVRDRPGQWATVTFHISISM